MADGPRLLRNKDKVRITRYEGESLVTSLSIYPCSFRDDEDGGETRQTVIARGRRTYQLLRKMPQLRSYDGVLLATQKRRVSLFDIVPGSF